MSKVLKYQTQRQLLNGIINQRQTYFHCIVLLGDALVCKPIQLCTIQIRTMKNERDSLLDELFERIAEGPIVFTPDEEFAKRVAEKEKKNNQND